MKGTILLTTAALLAVFSMSCGPSHNTLTIRFHYSRFEPSVATAPTGVPLTITLRNDDPIDHEWIIGTPDIHEVHRHGTEALHAHRPTEVTVPALSTRVTTVTFDEPGTFAYVCHLPGHEEYGMAGTLEARASR